MQRHDGHGSRTETRAALLSPQFKGLIMHIQKNLAISLLSCVLFALSGGAYAEGLAREQVRQQPIKAQQNGLAYVADASNPDISPVYQNEVDEQRATHAHNSDMGPQSEGSSQSGESAAMPTQQGSDHHDDCVGPVSFCNIYFGS
jgi:hypothetical protein